MTFSQYAGTAIVPTLARLILAAVFIPVGWNKVFKDAEFTADQATQLKSLGVNTEPADPPKVISTSSEEAGNVRFALASYRQEATPPPAVQPPADPAPAQEPKPQDNPAVEASTAPSTAVQPLPPGKYKAQALHQITLMLHQFNIPQPVWMARLAAFTELIGGAMILLGLFSRIWGLGLAIAMGMAFYLVSIKVNNVVGVDPRTLAENGDAFSTAALQLSLFVLAFGVFLTGAGPLSLDRMLFGGSDEAGPGEGKID
jgi:putative oxidoreductase